MDKKDVPYIVYEGAEARAERHIKRLIVALVLAVVMLFVSNAFWLYEWMQYKFIIQNFTRVSCVNYKRKTVGLG